MHQDADDLRTLAVKVCAAARSRGDYSCVVSSFYTTAAGFAAAYIAGHAGVLPEQMHRVCLGALTVLAVLFVAAAGLSFRHRLLLWRLGAATEDDAVAAMRERWMQTLYRRRLLEGLSSGTSPDDCQNQFGRL